MKIGVLGAGLMGKEAARDLVSSHAVEAVGIADVFLTNAEAVAQHLNSDKIKAFEVDANNHSQLEAYMAQFDVIINALFYTFNEKIAQAGVATGVHVVDLGGHIGHMTDKVLQLHDQAKEKGITIIPDLGVAPGMINILTGYGASALKSVKEINLYVGGIPLRPEPPLEYNHVFSMQGLMDHYTDPALIIRNGEALEVSALSEVERIFFDKFGPLEAFHTSGGTSTLPHTFSDVETLEYKTIRYPGHAEKFKLLVDLNLTRTDYEVDVRGMRVNPREVLLKAIDPIVELGDKDDVVLLRVIVSGTDEVGDEVTHEFEMVTYKNVEKKITAMARATANTISVVAQMIGGGLIKDKGVYPPEMIVPGKAYIEAMAKRHVDIKHIIY